jgi:aerobic carbon-monoxide dehydrogenase medium subunit
VKAPLFAYAKPSNLQAVFDLLERGGDGAKLLAGGQSLIPTLNLRLSSPSLLIDLNGLRDLSGITVAGDLIRVGAMTRQRELEASPEIARHLPLLAQAIPHIAHAAIRNRGTIGGSLAFADPAAELPACAVALDAHFVLASRKGERKIAARQFYTGLYETALRPGEVLVAAEFPVQAPAERSHFSELARRHGDYAMVGLAARAKREGGRLSDLQFAFFGVGAKPVLAAAAARAAAESPERAADALAKDLDPPADLNGSGATKLHLARVLLRRALHAMNEG